MRRGGDQRDEALFIDTRKPGQMVGQAHRELTDEAITIIANLKSPVFWGDGA